MPAPARIQQLVDRFHRRRDEYRRGTYNETQARVELINPFFEELGWDIDHRRGGVREVKHEDRVEVAGKAKAPDYGFHLNGRRVFFVEAKKPAVDLAGQISPAYQLRRYAWSARLPVSVLTDFEEFAVYDTRVRPRAEDKPAVARVLYHTYDQYLDRWDEIAALFGREAVLAGSLEQFAEKAAGKRGAATVDSEFLGEIERWRDLLARHLALRNPGLGERDLNFAVQQTIDRILFLRIAEDRGIEPYGALAGLLEGPATFDRLLNLFFRADARYNSGLFHFSADRTRGDPDLLTPRLAVDDKPLKDILRNLYYPAAPYEFSVFPAEVLGQVYEQFLGKVIRLTEGHRAVVEEKPEVRKAGGVYYTPSYIVDYIVRQTVGKLVEGHVPDPQGPVSRLRILDPACGSGSFLIGAYQFLLDWHLAGYVASDPEKWRKKRVLHRTAAGEWVLSLAERKRILLDNLYGVDIDAQAVEVTKLSLLLKVLEGDPGALSGQMALLPERVLPDLGDNIKCGNSLIGPDFYARDLTGLLRPVRSGSGAPGNGPAYTDDELLRINAFDWHTEFKDIMSSDRSRFGGFDAVIGNPPYGMVTDNAYKGHFQQHFVSAEGRFDTFELFIEKGLSLCRDLGYLGFIVPSPLLTNLYSRKLRRHLLTQASILEITNFGMDVFLDPTIHTCIIVLSNTAPVTGHHVSIRKQVNLAEQLSRGFTYTVDQALFGDNANSTFDIFFEPETRSVLTKMQERSKPLGELCYIRQCIKTGNDKELVRTFETGPGDPWKPTLRGRSIGRYITIDDNIYLKYGPWLARNWNNITFYETPKIAIRETGDRITATIDLENRYLLSSLYSVYWRRDGQHSLLYLLGLLNSRIATYFMKAVALEVTKGAFTKIRTNQLGRLPIRVIDFTDPADAARHDRMAGLVTAMLDLHKRLAAEANPQTKVFLQRQIEATDRQIDQLVYELYDLTDEEIKIVEGS